MSGYCDKCGNTLCVCAQELYEHRNDPGEWGEEPADILVRPYQGLIKYQRILDWVRGHDWRVTTEHECYGYDNTPDGMPEAYAIYDANEDDPPIAVCGVMEDALNIVEALRAFANREEFLAVDWGDKWDSLPEP